MAWTTHFTNRDNYLLPCVGRLKCRVGWHILYLSTIFIAICVGSCRTPLNASAFGVTLDSSVKNRPGQQTKSTSPGRLQFGVIICYYKIKRKVTGQCSAYHKMVVLDLVWTTDPGKWWGGVQDGWKYGWHCLTVRSSKVRLIKFWNMDFLLNSWM